MHELHVPRCRDSRFAQLCSSRSGLSQCSCPLKWPLEWCLLALRSCLPFVSPDNLRSRKNSVCLVICPVLLWLLLWLLWFCFVFFLILFSVFGWLVGWLLCCCFLCFFFLFLFCVFCCCFLGGGGGGGILLVSFCTEKKASVRYAHKDYRIYVLDLHEDVHTPPPPPPLHTHTCSQVDHFCEHRYIYVYEHSCLDLWKSLSKQESPKLGFEWEYRRESLQTD